MVTPLEFEKKINELETKLEELRELANHGELNIAGEMTKLQTKVEKLLAQTYADLKPWEKVLVARHQDRPNFNEYVGGLFTEFTPLAGDRNFAEDHAIGAGLARFQGIPVVVMGHQRGRDTETRLKYNFGMARPEGYRKAKRLMNMANQFNLPLITLVDTAGAHPGIDAEERGQSEAIASCIETGGLLGVPVISIITGEGGSGGAIALAVANEVSMLEHAIYSVISPEGCASILWRTSDNKDTAAAALKMTAQDLMRLKVIDRIITEPLGGAHRNPQMTIRSVGEAISSGLEKLIPLNPEALMNHRQEKFLEMGRNLA